MKKCPLCNSRLEIKYFEQKKKYSDNSYTLSKCPKCSFSLSMRGKHDNMDSRTESSR